MMAAAIRVLYVDDESPLLDIGKVFLEKSGDFTVTTATSASDAIRLLEQERFDVIVSDYQMPDMDGIQFLKHLKAKGDTTPFIIFTGKGREEVVIEALNGGADSYLQKGGESGAQFAELSHKVKQAAARKKAEDSLKRIEEQYRHLIEHANEAIVVAQDGMLKLVNHRAVEFTGYLEQELLSMSFTAFIHPDDRAMVMERYQKRLKGEEFPSRYAFRLSPKDGSTRWVEISVAAIDWESRPATLNFLTDITERKRAEEALQESELFNRGLVENLPDYIVVYGTDGKILYVNPAAVRAIGYSAEELVGTSVLSYVAPECRDEATAKMAARREGGNPSAYELDIIAQDGLRRSVITKGTRIQYRDTPATLLVLTDITERKRAEDALVVSEARFRDGTTELSATNLKLEKEIGDRIKIQKKLILSATEKDLLLREVHHRVKNNLQLIIGLIDMTKTRAHEPVVLSTLTSIMAKVQTMGLVHTQLYESKRVDKVSMKRQVQDLVDMISGFYDHEHHDITTNINCPDIYLPVDLAIPCALALNEIISNIHKHAFKGKRNGLVEISLSVKGDQLRIAVRDNGVGLPPGFNIEKSNRLGLKLMRTLVEQQLHGTVQITSKAGTEVVIEFPINQGECAAQE